MSEIHYSLNVIRAAFWATFHESGEKWFNYLSTPEQNAEYTQGSCEEFMENLVETQRERLAPAIAAIRALGDEAGHLHIVLDDGNYEDGDMSFCEGYNAQNLHEMTDDQLVLERSCLTALWPLTPYEREMANTQAEADSLEGFYQKHPERRP